MVVYMIIHMHVYIAADVIGQDVCVVYISPSIYIHKYIGNKMEYVLKGRTHSLACMCVHQQTPVCRVGVVSFHLLNTHTHTYT